MPPAPLANDYLTLYRSPRPAHWICSTPGLTRLRSGRLVATHSLKAIPPATLPPPLTPKGEGPFQWQTHVSTSDDAGHSWTHRVVLPMLHARPFEAGPAGPGAGGRAGRVYVLGHAGDLAIARSDDGGATWSETALLTQGQWWHQAATPVEYARGRVYLVMERRTHQDLTRWDVSAIAPVLMAASVDADLLERESWAFSNEITFQQAVADAGLLRGLGVPFFPSDPEAARALGARPLSAPGWLETNVVRFRDSRHIWFDPQDRTVYLWLRTHTGTSNLAAVLRGAEDASGRLTVGLASAPTGQPLVFLPCPGGHLKFHIVWDEPSGLFWMASSQSTDSMARPDRLPAGRYGLPYNERQSLALHFSANCVDWCYAGLVAAGAAPGQSRHYASITPCGDDLLVLSRSGDAQARNGHDCNLITLHRVPRFRDLSY